MNTLNKTEEELLQCPFCGSIPRREVKNDILVIECPSCVSVGFHNHVRFGCRADEEWNTRIAHANTQHSKILEDYDRLAKLAEKQAEEIEQQKERNALMKSNMQIREEELQDELSAANAAIATLRSRIATIAENCPHTKYDQNAVGNGNFEDAYDHGSDMARSVVGDELRELLDNPTLQVSEWEEKKLEPLWKQIAMLRDCICKYGKIDSHYFELSDALENTQAADAYLVEEKAKALEDFAHNLEKAQVKYIDTDGILFKAAQIRASANKITKG